MAITDIKILCRGYSWYGVVPREEIYKANFFSGINPAPFTEEIDLTNFLTQNGMGKIIYEFDTSVQLGDGTNELFFVASDLNLSLTNFKTTSNGDRLSDYFRINQDTSFIKYKVSIYYKNKLVYLGIIDQDGIEIPFGTSNESEIIQCKVLGYEKEFVDFYQNDYLKPNSDITWEINGSMPYVQFQSSISNEGDPELVRPASLSLKKVIAANMSNTLLPESSIRLEYPISEYIVVQTPFFYKADNTHELIWAKTSYERIQYANHIQETKWNWLKRLCNGMGWVIFFFLDNENFCLGIKNRSSINLPGTNLEVRNFIDFRITKDKSDMTYDNLVIIDGTLIGSDHAFYNNGNLKGEQLIIMSDYNKQNFNTSFISGVSVGGSYSLNFNNPYIHYYNDDGDNFRYSTLTSSGDSTPDISQISKKRTIFVDTGDAGTEAQFVNLQNKANGRGFSIGTTDIIESESGKWLVYKGCYANMLLLRVGEEWQSYYQYVKTTTFANNFAKFRSTKQNKKFTGRYAGIILNPFQQFKLLNDPNNIISAFDTYSIHGMSIDLVEETTELDLYVSKTFSF